MSEQQQYGIVPEWTTGNRMRRALDVAGLTVEDMADYLEVARSTVGRWINDRGNVKKTTLRLWALRTGVSLIWLETGEAPDQYGPGLPDSLPRLDSNQQPSGYPSPLVRNAA